MAAFRPPISDHHVRWHRVQTLAAAGAGLTLLWVMIAVVVILADWRAPPQNLPWKPLDLGDPVGLFTRGKVARAEGAACRAILAKGGVAYRDAPQELSGEFCSIRDGVDLESGTAPLAPSDPVMTCSEALAFSLWERQVVQPAAYRTLGSGVVRIEHYGAFSCRRQYGAKDGPISEHALANAIDISAFVLADGRRVVVADDWADADDKGVFLHQVRDGACGVFAVTLSPDYNAPHHDHLHLDMGRGPFCH